MKIRMPEIPAIPRLVDLCYQHPQFQDDYAKFADNFVRLHNRNWKIAQDHWEIMVQKMLNSREISTRARPRVAMNQAVIAAATLLTDNSLSNQCPLCPAPDTTRVDQSHSQVVNREINLTDRAPRRTQFRRGRA